MFERLGSFTYRFRLAIVAFWIGAAAAAALFAPSLATEGTTDEAAFLPPTTQSALARDALERAFPGEAAAGSATISFYRPGFLRQTDRAYLAQTASWITSAAAPSTLREAVTRVDTTERRPELAPMLRSRDGELELLLVNLNVAGPGETSDGVVAALRDHLAATAPAGLQANVTGSAGVTTDYLAAIVRGTESTTAVTVALVIIILLVIYRAPLAAMVPLATIAAAYVVSRAAVGILAVAGWKVSSLLDTFIVVLVFGVGTDYTIFLISRYREELSRGDWQHASRATMKRIGAVISASAATVIVGLGSMAFGDFGMIQTTGPALAVTILVTLIAGLTLAPALLAIFGHYLFWPLHNRTAGTPEQNGAFARLAIAVSRRPALVATTLLIALVVPVTAVPQMRTNFDVLSELPADSDARAGFEQVSAHLGRGKIVQSTAIVDLGSDGNMLAPVALARLRDLGAELVSTPGVGSVTGLLSPKGDGKLPAGFQPSKQLASMARALERDRSTTTSDADRGAILDPKVSAGLASASGYLTALGAAFTDVAKGKDFGTTTADLARAQELIGQARLAATVSTQVRMLADAMRSPVVAASPDGYLAMAGSYLTELVHAYPEVRPSTAFDQAMRVITSPGTASAADMLELVAALESIARDFDSRPTATLVPTSVPDTPAMIALRRELQGLFGRLPREFDALSTTMVKRADDVFVPTGLGGEGADAVNAAVAAFVSKGGDATRLYLTTSDDPYSTSAFESVRRSQGVLADAAASLGEGASAYLGGPTAQLADVQTVLDRDFQRVGVITVLGILVVLVLLLRALVAPLYLVGTVLLSCASAIGLSSWFFQSVLGHAGVSFYLPLMVFVLLVALGSDYNIFLMSRVREESAGRPIRDGIRIASGRTGAVITSAGLILAGTFGSMASAPLIVLFQVGVAVAVGVLIDTFLVRSILVPAITTLAGERAWWPTSSGGSRKPGP